MKARFKGPSGTGVIDIPDEATVRILLEEIRIQTGIQSFSVKYGPPMAMRALDTSNQDVIAKSIGLNGETLTIIPEALPPPLDPSQRSSEMSMKDSTGDTNATSTSPEDITVPWLEREGTLLLRVMPSDNSCLFTAFGGALAKQISAPLLRRMMAEYIMEHADVYTEAVLGSAPSEYCQKIQDPDRWGGGIELSILSTIFDMQISTYDVQNQNLMNFGEDKTDRCILVYSGIHYDRVAFSYSDYPHAASTLPPEMDRTIWPTDDVEVMEKAAVLVGKLEAAHYYTDTEGLVLKCNIPGCEWIGSGQAEAQKHAAATGHTDLSEIADTTEDNVLKACNAAGCDFMGQGERAMRRHTSDTGHQTFSVIPDY